MQLSYVRIKCLLPGNPFLHFEYTQHYIALEASFNKEDAWIFKQKYYPLVQQCNIFQNHTLVSKITLARAVILAFFFGLIGILTIVMLFINNIMPTDHYLTNIYFIKLY